MNETQFWKLIDASRKRSNGDHDAQLDYLLEKLESKEPAEIVEFQKRLNEQLSRAYRWDLIGAACFIGVGMSDDGFLDFRAWLLAQGRETFEKVLEDPQRLAEFEFGESPTEEWHFEALVFAAEELLGDSSDEDADIPYYDNPPVSAGDPFPITVSELQARFPRLWERFGDKWMIGIS